MADYNSTYTGAQIDANLALAATATQPGDDAAGLGSGSATDGYVLTADGAGGAAWEAAAGGGGTPGGTDTQVQFNDGGAFGGDSGFTFDKTNNTLGLGGGTITANDPIIDMAQTWNNGAVAFTALKANVTDTASAAGSLLMDLQVGGVSRFSVNKNAGISFRTASKAIDFNDSYGLQLTTGSSLAFAIGSANSAIMTLGQWTVDRLGFGISTGFVTHLQQDGSTTHTLAQRNGVNAQAFNLYNTYTDASNYERGFMRFVSNTLEIGTGALGTGAIREVKITGGTNSNNIIVGNNGVFLSNGATNQWYLNNSGDFYTILDNLRDLGGTSTNRPRNINAATSINAPRVQVNVGFTVATLPASPVVGMMARVTDATTPIVGSTVTGGGAAAALCWYNGTNWTVIGV